MTLHKRTFPEQATLTEALKSHGLETDTPSQLADAFRLGWQAAINHERSECAKVCDAMGGPGHSGYRGDADNEDCAAAIRARSQP